MNITKISDPSGDVFVVDSRLLAERLGIQHESFLRTLDTYRTQAEQAFGVFRFEIGKPIGPQGGRPSRYCLLTEDQATFIMSLSRNTPEVVQCKLDLVQAFSTAKRLLQSGKQTHNLEWFDRLKLYRAKTKIPTGWFSIFEEMTLGLMADFEDAGYALPLSSVPDISVGKCFCSHLRGLGVQTTDPANVRKYRHHYPDGRQVDANIYSDRLLPEYRRWFKEAYRLHQLPRYLKDKDPNALPTLCGILGLPEGAE